MHYKREFHDMLYKLSVAIDRALEADYLDMAELPEAFIFRLAELHKYLKNLPEDVSIFQDKLFLSKKK